MAKLSINEALEEIKSYDGNEFFSLKNDMETATVRFLIDSTGVFDIYLVHQVEINGKKRWVDCPKEHCPICAGGNRPQVKLFLQLLDTRDNKVKTWERGSKFIKDMQGLQRRNPVLSALLFDVERHGKPRDPGTTYVMYPIDNQGRELGDLPQKQELYGNFILVKTMEELTQIAQGMSGGATSSYGGGGNTGYSDPADTSAPQQTRRREPVAGEDVF